MQVFLILNYNTSTLCIDLLNQIIDLNQPIVVVDNNSNANDYNKIAEFSKNYPQITLLRLDTNDGFSAGNNFGYRYVKDNFKEVEAIHCLNTDIIIHQPEQLITSVKANIKNNYVLAPQVLTNGFLSTPLVKRNINKLKKDAYQEILMYRKKIKKHKIVRLAGPLYRQYMQKNGSFVLKEDYKVLDSPLADGEYYVYNGCYLIFTQNYIKEYDYLFNPQTFLYYEEDFLFYRLYCNHQKVNYIEEVVVDHLENIDSRKDIVKRYQNLLDSCLKFNQELYEQ